jgi:hypothetical protein
MDPNPELTKLAYQVLEELVENFPPPRMSYGPDYDLIELPEGYEKPPKEEFEAKLQELMAAQPLKELRTKRNTVLDQSDKYATIDYPHATVAKQQEWLDYRQALRDLPSVTEDPLNPVWPTIPTA